ncbi:uncharacterized protein [Miscanthus floridulus]|uniref:uncharacterized protein n=1 Tax=Miscanthus floridulus TaxID=154761 RepID=UPI0034590DD3
MEMELASESSEMELAPVSDMELAPDSEMEVVPDSITPNSEMELTLDSEMEVVPDSITPDSEMELAPDSEMEVVPDSLPPGSFLCARCHLVHEDRQAWNRAHSRLWPCSRCGLIHADYIIHAMLHGLDEFDCELFINCYKELLPGRKDNQRELAAKKDDAKASQE